MAATVLVYMDSPTVEVTEVRPATLELITAGRALGRVDVVCLGAPSLDVLATLGTYGVDQVHQAELPAVVPENAQWLTEVLSEVLVEAVQRVHADLLLVPTTFAAKEAAAVAAARMGAGFVAHALTISSATESTEPGIAVPTDAKFRSTTLAFAGAWYVEMELATDPAVVALQPGGVTPEPAAAPTQPEVYPLPVTVGAPLVEVISRELKPHTDGRPDLAGANVIVAGGRGVNGDLTPVFELADALGAAVGVTRDIAFEGLYDEYVGTTGVTVAPSLYVAAGISGSPYHVGGMRSSRYVVSVNNDDDAPIKEISDLFIVGDLAAVLPAAAQKLKARVKN